MHIGSRVSALAGPNDVLVSSTLRDLVIRSELVFEERGARSSGACPASASFRRRVEVLAVKLNSTAGNGLCIRCLAAVALAVRRVGGSGDQITFTRARSANKERRLSRRAEKLGGGPHRGRLPPLRHRRRTVVTQRFGSCSPTESPSAHIHVRQRIHPRAHLDMRQYATPQPAPVHNAGTGDKAGAATRAQRVRPAGRGPSLSASTLVYRVLGGSRSPCVDTRDDGARRARMPNTKRPYTIQ